MADVAQGRFGLTLSVSGGVPLLGAPRSVCYLQATLFGEQKGKQKVYLE